MSAATHWISLLRKEGVLALKSQLKGENLTSKERKALGSELRKLGEDALRRVGNLSQALAALELASSLIPKDAATWALLGQVWHCSALVSEEPGDLAHAVRCFRHAERLAPLPSLCAGELGAILAELGHRTGQLQMLEEAIVVLQQGVENAKDPSEQAALWGTLATELGRIALFFPTEALLTQALERLEEAMRRDPLNGVLLITRARLLGCLALQWDRGEVSGEALRCAAQAVELAPDHAHVRFYQLALLLQLGESAVTTRLLKETQNTLRDLRRCSGASHYAPLGAGLLHLTQGIYFQDSTHLRRAVVYFEEASQLEPRYPLTWQNLGRALFHLGIATEESTLVQRAIDAFARYVRLQPFCKEGRLEHMVILMHHASEEADSDCCRRVIAHIEEWIDKIGVSESLYKELVFHLGRAYQLLGEIAGEVPALEHATELLTEALEAEPLDLMRVRTAAVCHVQLGERTGDMERMQRGVEMLEVLLQDESDDGELWVESGFGLLQMSRCCHHTEEVAAAHHWARASVARLQRGVALGHPPARYLLGCAYACCEEEELALQALQAAQEAGELPPASELLTMPEFECLHGKPAFEALLDEEETDG